MHRLTTCCLNFIFIDSLNRRFSYHPTAERGFANCKPVVFQVSTRPFLCIRKLCRKPTLLLCTRLTTKYLYAFLVGLKPFELKDKLNRKLQNSLPSQRPDYFTARTIAFLYLELNADFTYLEQI